jgi:hypothetical protein
MAAQSCNMPLVVLALSLPRRLDAGGIMGKQFPQTRSRSIEFGWSKVQW